jgi:hypothetical protein
MPVEPGGPQPLGKGRPGRLSAGSASACSAATDGRSRQPARTPTPAGTARDHDHLGRFRERMPTVQDRGRSRSRGRRRWLRIRGRRASSTACSEVGSAAVGRSHASGRRSVMGVEHFPARGRGGDVALSPSPPSSFGRQHGRRVRRRASPGQPGLVVSPQPEIVAPPQAVAERPATPPGRSRPSAGRSSEPRSPPCHQVWKALPRNGDLGPFRNSIDSKRQKPPRNASGDGRAAGTKPGD